MAKKTLAELDKEIAQGRETLLRKRVCSEIRGLDARDRDEIQSRIERIVREINMDGGNRIGIQGDLRHEDYIEVWDVVAFSRSIVAVDIETGKVKIR